MKMIKIDKSKWANGIQKLKETHLVYGPIKENKGYQFKQLEINEMPDFSFINSELSPKSILFPPSQDLFTYVKDPSSAKEFQIKETLPDTHPRIILGIRPCDAKAIEMVKLNFDTPKYQDPYWLNLYNTTLRVGLACKNPSSHCFCTTAGSGPYNEEGLDILLSEETQFYIAKAITPKGEALLEEAGFTEKMDGKALFLAQKNTAEDKISAFIPTDRLKAKDTLSLHDAPFWEDVSFACINCGVCTYSCPTCWCFDIVDTTHKTSGTRKKIWDSCMFPLFTLHTSGHNPRETKLKRLRQRFMHKLKYFVDKYDSGIMCVGCGRCVELCPSNIDIKKISHQMNEYGSEHACNFKEDPQKEKG